jgi:hypothetical protein
VRVCRVLSFQPTFGLVSQDEIRELTQNYPTPLKASIIVSSASFSRVTDRALDSCTMSRSAASNANSSGALSTPPRVASCFPSLLHAIFPLAAICLLFFHPRCFSFSILLLTSRARDNELESALHPSVARTVIQDLRESSSRCLQVRVPSHTLTPLRCFTPPAVPRLAGRACQARPRAARLGDYRTNRISLAKIGPAQLA